MGDDDGDAAAAEDSGALVHTAMLITSGEHQSSGDVMADAVSLLLPVSVPVLVLALVLVQELVPVPVPVLVLVLVLVLEFVMAAV